MERFFPRFRQQPDIEQGSGSGFIVSADGYILTNNHVVEGAEQVTVRLLDRREFKAKVIGSDPNTDVAVVKIDAKALPPISLGNSDDARVGEWVLAIGNPLGEGLTFTVTSGIVSAKGRALQGLPGRGQGSIQDFIQTDAAINPGNSGGPLVSVRGEVIGINSAIASETGFYSGYGFAIPIDLARRVMDQIVSEGRVHRVALGIMVQDATPNDAAYVGLPDIRGVLVQDFGEKSPAKKAGMEAGDIIVSIDGKPVEYVGQLQQQIAFRKPGETVKVEVARKGGVRKTLEVRLQEVAAPRAVAGRGSDESNDTVESDDEGATSIDLLGLTVQPVDQDAVTQFDLAPDQRGLLITAVTPGGPSDGEVADPDAGGPDILLSVEGKSVKSIADLKQALKSYKKDEIVSLRLYNTQAKSRRIERIRLGE
jgi:serine protease Do